MENQFQNLTEVQRNELVKILQIFEELFNGTLCAWKIDPVDLKVKYDLEPVCSRTYPVPKVQE